MMLLAICAGRFVRGVLALRRQDGPSIDHLLFYHEIWCMYGFTPVCGTISSNGETMLDCNRITCDVEIMVVCEAMLGQGGNYVREIFVLLK